MKYLTREYEQWTKTVKKALIDRQLSTAALAREMGECRPNLAALLNGRYISDPMVKRISDYLGIAYPGEESAS